MRWIRGVQAEVLVSLTFLMVTATLVLAAVMLHTQSMQFEALRGPTARGLLAEAKAATFEVLGSSHGITWWIVDEGRTRPVGGHREVAGHSLRELAVAARREQSPVMASRQPWEPLRFAAPLGPGRGIAIAEIAPVVSGSVLLVLLIADCVVFIAMGSYLLRRGVILPLHQLADAARAIGQGAEGTRVIVSGEGESAEVARAFNEMTESLEQRSRALEKAVADLRVTNQSLRRARDGLDRSERLAAVGSLAAGVAHEVGNPMGALLAFLEIARRDPSLSVDATSHLERASEQGSRVREILRQLLDFSRPPRSCLQPMDLTQAAEQTVGLLKAQRRFAKVRFSIETAEPVPEVMADEGIVAQILLNLLLNAGDAALDGGPDPQVLLCLRLAPLFVRAGDPRENHRNRKSVDGVECVVVDSGSGIAEEIRERIFDPFFTTKDPGEGTGLGLANVLRLAEQLGGGVELGRDDRLPGATFVFRLPRADPERERGGLREREIP